MAILESHIKQLKVLPTAKKTVGHMLTTYN